MAVYPVIMCGGSGTRLWPASRPWRPKQFIPLTGARSSFQETLVRVAPLAEAGPVLVVAGIAHQALIEAQLAEIGGQAVVLLEPEPRDSAAAIAAACAWIEARDPDAVAVIVSADHHIPDADAFRAAVAQTLPAAREGAVVTLGVEPTEPATAYGYIRPGAGAEAVKPVAAFVEKPDAERARAYVADGYLWNSGNFVATARTLMDELGAHAPGVAKAARAGVADLEANGAAWILGRPFRQAPKISIDYAVMEKTARAAVLPVAFEWSDVGAWDAVLAGSDRDADGNSLSGNVQAVGARDLLVRASDDLHVAVVGASNLAVIVEPDVVLVCDLAASQDVKAAAAAAPPGGRGRRFTTLEAAADWYDLWFRTAALPLWSTLGADPVNGGFREALTAEGEAVDPRRRARTQARQVFVFATAAAIGAPGPWLEVARRGWEFYAARGLRKDGRTVSVLTVDGAPLDETACLYEHAFLLLALSALARAEPGDARWRTEGARARAALEIFRHPAGGFRETGPQPYQANAHMHLFEAALAWEAVEPDGGWGRLADEVADLALERFIDPDSGVLREFFDAGWAPLTGEAGLVEPGHQFEWAWLLERWGRARGAERGLHTARRLYEVGRAGVDASREVAVNALWDDLAVRDGYARLWPQTERLKAAVLLGEEADAISAARGLARYLETPARGAWRDKLRPDGGFVDEPAPATSLYHLTMAVLELTGRAG